MKAYTDLSQSKTLTEILPIDSADMCWCNNSVRGVNYTGKYSAYLYTIKEMKDSFDKALVGWNKYWVLIPAWSLNALLEVLPTLDGRNAEFCKDIHNNQWHVYYHSTATLPMEDTERYDNLIDACYEMIINLHKEGLL